VKLLAEKTTWHDFFVPEHERKSKLVLSQHHRKGSTSTTSNPRRASSATQRTDQNQEWNTYGRSSGGNYVDEDLADDFGLEESFREMITHIEILWDELKVPFPDQKFYKESLLKGPPSGIEQCQEVGRYINMLKLHRKATISTLKAIQQREAVLEKLFDFLYAFAQMEMRLNNRRQGSTISANYATTVMIEELVQLLREVQWANIETIRAIQLWRRNLWRPLPFVWNGCNYLSKMQSDTNVILADEFSRLLANIPLTRDDLVCIVFGLGKSPLDLEKELELRRRNTFGSTSSLLRGSDALESSGNNVDVAAAQAALAASKDAYDTESATGVAAAAAQPQVKCNTLRDMLFADRNIRELRAAARVVDEEGKLQKALKVEHKSLVAMNVFIPLLKLRPSATPKTMKGSTSMPNLEQNLGTGSHQTLGEATFT
jgi:hypothetical protein